MERGGMVRKRQLNVRVEERTRQRIKELAAAWGFTEGHIIEMAVARLIPPSAIHVLADSPSEWPEIPRPPEGSDVPVQAECAYCGRTTDAPDACSGCGELLCPRCMRIGICLACQTKEVPF